MNSDTGEILNEKQMLKFQEEFGISEAEEKLVPIEDGEMTKAQEETKQVSKHDNKSVLGKKFTTARKFKKNKYGRI